MKLQHKLGTLFSVREGEGRPLVFLLIHSFLIGLVVVFYDTAASALFLDNFNADTLPYAYIIASVVVPVVGFIYS